MADCRLVSFDKGRKDLLVLPKGFTHSSPDQKLQSAKGREPDVKTVRFSCEKAIPRGFVNSIVESMVRSIVLLRVIYLEGSFASMQCSLDFYLLGCRHSARRVTATQRLNLCHDVEHLDHVS